VDNSVDPSSQSTVHAEACSVIVSVWTWSSGALPPPLADLRVHLEGFCVGDGDIRDQLRRACQEGTYAVVSSGRRWSRLDWAAAKSEHSCCRHGDVAEETTSVENSVDPASRSTAHAEVCSVIVEPVDMEFRRITSTVG